MQALSSQLHLNRSNGMLMLKLLDSRAMAQKATEISRICKLGLAAMSQVASQALRVTRRRMRMGMILFLLPRASMPQFGAGVGTRPPSTTSGESIELNQ